MCNESSRRTLFAILGVGLLVIVVGAALKRRNDVARRNTAPSVRLVERDGNTSVYEITAA